MFIYVHIQINEMTATYLKSSQQKRPASALRILRWEFFEEKKQDLKTCFFMVDSVVEILFSYFFS